ncbi:hypothetical protein HDV05_004992 [Chytridiales sp. JEL 0842]|nr:hypothetical protein HDV05_004992 [Chytridiales sp. JEL 0842]
MADILGPFVVKGLNDKLYDKRKTAALEVEKLVREAYAASDSRRISQILNSLITEFVYSVTPHARNGGLIALAAASIALGPVEVVDYLDVIIPPILACFGDPESKVRYYACESMYNVAKVARGEVLKYFNEIFDALSKLTADTDASVKNGSELLDRLIKDIVCERATYYPATGTMTGSNTGRSTASVHTTGDELTDQNLDNSFSEHTMDSSQQLKPTPTSTSASATQLPSSPQGPVTDSPSTTARHGPAEPYFPPTPGSQPLPNPSLPPTTFNLPRFIPLLTERIKALNPSTRMFLVQWISTLDSVPDLELVAHLPEFLDGLFAYLGDPSHDLRVATLNLLGEFLKEVKETVEVQRRRGVVWVRGRRGYEGLTIGLLKGKGGGQGVGMERGGSAVSVSGGIADGYSASMATGTTAVSGPSAGAIVVAGVSPSSATSTSGAPYTPYQNVPLDIPRIVDILTPHLSSTDPETQTMALRWTYELLGLVREILLPCVPQLLGAVLLLLEHPVEGVRVLAGECSARMGRLVIETEAWEVGGSLGSSASAGSSGGASVSSTGGGGFNPFPSSSDTPQQATSVESKQSTSADGSGASGFTDPFDIPLTLDTLVTHLQDEHEATRIAALDWLLTLHRRAPRRVLSNLGTPRSTPADDSAFHALLRALSDSSEQVVKRDLQLLAQLSVSNGEGYFMQFMVNLLTLFSIDRRLLETRGALIVRQLCLSLEGERMYRAFAEILERDEDLEFASTMVQNLNIILITAPELSDLRRRLKNLDTRDGLLLFAILYRSWSHNPVAAFSLCLLAQAYEHASALLQTFADLDVTLNLLIQLDKLVQLLESPVFTSLRLQLLEPQRYPHLYKCLYGILMLLPQSAAFATLRNRLNSVGGLVMLYGGVGGGMGIGVGGVGFPPMPSSGSAGSGKESGGKRPPAPPLSKGPSQGGGYASGSAPLLNTPNSGNPGSQSPSFSSTNPLTSASEPLTLKWNELLHHFRTIQSRHERLRRHQHAASNTTSASASFGSPLPSHSNPTFTVSQGPGSITGSTKQPNEKRRTRSVQEPTQFGPSNSPIYGTHSGNPGSSAWGGGVGSGGGPGSIMEDSVSYLKPQTPLGMASTESSGGGFGSPSAEVGGSVGLGVGGATVGGGNATNSNSGNSSASSSRGGSHERLDRLGVSGRGVGNVSGAIVGGSGGAGAGGGGGAGNQGGGGSGASIQKGIRKVVGGVSFGIRK